MGVSKEKHLFAFFRCAILLRSKTYLQLSVFSIQCSTYAHFAPSKPLSHDFTVQTNCIREIKIFIEICMIFISDPKVCVSYQIKKNGGNKCFPRFFVQTNYNLCTELIAHTTNNDMDIRSFLANIF